MSTSAAVPEGTTLQNVSATLANPVVDPSAQNAAPAPAAPNFATQENYVDGFLHQHFILSRTVTWSNSQPPGTILAEFRVDPRQSNNLVKYIAKMYNAWSGQLQLAAKICGTGFHAGAIALIKIPPNVDYKGKTMQQLTCFPYILMDPKNQEVEGFDMSDQRNVMYHWFSDDQAKQTFGGTVVVMVYVTLTLASSGSTSIAIAFSQRLGPDFQFYQMIDPSMEVNKVDPVVFTAPVGNQQLPLIGGVANNLHIINSSTYTNAGINSAMPLSSVKNLDLYYPDTFWFFYSSASGRDENRCTYLNYFGATCATGPCEVERFKEVDGDFKLTVKGTEITYTHVYFNPIGRLDFHQKVSTSSAFGPFSFTLSGGSVNFPTLIPDTAENRAKGIATFHNEKIMLFSPSATITTVGFCMTQEWHKCLLYQPLKGDVDHQFQLYTDTGVSLFACRLSRYGFFSVHADIKAQTLTLAKLRFQYVGEMSQLETLPKPGLSAAADTFLQTCEANRQLEVLNKRLHKLNLLHDLRELESCKSELHSIEEMAPSTSAHVDSAYGSVNFVENDIVLHG